MTLAPGRDVERNTWGASYNSSRTSQSRHKWGDATASVELIVIAPLSFNTAAALTDQNVALRVSRTLLPRGECNLTRLVWPPGSSMPDGLAFASQNSLGLIQGTPTKPAVTALRFSNRQLFATVKISQTFTLNITNNLVLPQYTCQTPSRISLTPIHKACGRLRLISLFLGKIPPYRPVYYWTQQPARSPEHPLQ